MKEKIFMILYGREIVFIAHRCSNARGHCMALGEYGDGGRQNFIFIPEERGGKGLRKLAHALRESGRVG